MDRMAMAKDVAARVAREHFEEHRGAMALPGGVAAVFGNDGYDRDGRARHEVEVVRRRREEGVEEPAFATSDDGYTWAMIVRGAEPDFLHQTVRRAWYDANEAETPGAKAERKREMDDAVRRVREDLGR